VVGKDGKPAHSWRVLLLEYLDQRELLAQYNFDEPWDGPNNRKLADRMPRSYRVERHPNNDKKFTSYVVLVGPHTAFPGATPVKLADIKDGLGSTILIAESENFDVHWMEPRDWDVERNGVQIATAREPGFSSFNRIAPAIALADAIITGISWKALAEQLKAMSTIAGGEKVDLKAVTGGE
jgi:hypothetical protein